MTRIGYHLSCEEHAPVFLVDNAVRAERAGFDAVMVSDHFHPWTDFQGESPFVWAVLGAVAARTERLEAVTGVTCPTMRIHPAVIAQAAATISVMMPGRFTLGVGTGEKLNEHVTGAHWPPIAVRLEMLIEAIDVIRRLWTGELVSHRGRHFTVQTARIYTRPDEPPPVAVAASGKRSARAAGEHADALVGISPSAEVVEAFRQGGGKGATYGKLDVCYARSRSEALDTAFRWWPNSGFPGLGVLDLPLPSHMEDLAKLVKPEHVARSVICGPDPDPIVDRVRAYSEAGFDHVILHQVGPEQDGFLDFAERELLPRLR